MHGYNLVALIFVREINDDLTGLVKTLDKQLDETMRKHKPSTRFGVFVILLTEDARMPQKLKDLAAREGLKQVVLANCNAADLNRYRGRYQLAQEADVTVAVYTGPGYQAKVSANFALKKGGLNKQQAEAIFGAVTRVLPR